MDKLNYQNMFPVSVYEAYVKLYEKMNEIIEQSNELVTDTDNKIEIMKQILDEGLEGIKPEINNQLYELINNGTIEEIINTNIFNDLNSQIKERATKQELAIEKSRIDNLAKLPAGSTTGDAELIDGRVGSDGINYDTLGQSIRTQVNRLNSELFFNPNFTKLNLTFVEGYYNLSGSIVTGNGNFRSEIKVKAGETYKIKGASFWQMPMYVILKSNGTLKTTFPTTATSETYEKEVNIVEDGTLIVNYTHSRSGSGEEYKPIVYKKVYTSEITNIKNNITNINNNVTNINNNVTDTNNAINSIKNILYSGEYTSIDLDFIEGATSITGTIMGSDSYYHCDIEIDLNCKYKVTGYNFWAMPLYLILDSNGNILDTYPKTAVEGAFIEKELSSFPVGAKTLRINYTSSYAGTGEKYKSRAYKTDTIFAIYDSEMTQLKNDISTVNDNVNITNTSVSKIKDLIYTDNYTKLDLDFKSGATSITGSSMTGDSYYHCDIEIDLNCKYKVTGYNFWAMPLYLILDEEGNILDTYPKSAIEGSLIEKEISSFPNGSKTLRINYTSSYAGTGEKYKSRAYKTDTIFDDTPIKNIGRTSNLTSIFTKYGIIGDSLSCGAQDIENGNSAVDMPQFSWATFLEKATGCDTVRLSKGGLQLKNWHAIMENKARLEENKCPAYIILLGHNDTASNVGSISDIDLNNLSNSNTDTQFGMYGKLIGTLRDISPDCKIFCVTYPINYVENFGTNKIPRTLPDYIDNCYCIDLWKYDKNRREEGNTSFAYPNPHFGKIHGTVLGYKNWSNIIDSYIDYIIRHNMSDFADVGYINTGYTFN